MKCCEICTPWGVRTCATPKQISSDAGFILETVSLPLWISTWQLAIVFRCNIFTLAGKSRNWLTSQEEYCDKHYGHEVSSATCTAVLLGEKLQETFLRFVFCKCKWAIFKIISWFTAGIRLHLRSTRWRWVSGLEGQPVRNSMRISTGTYQQRKLRYVEQHRTRIVHPIGHTLPLYFYKLSGGKGGRKESFMMFDKFPFN